MLYKCLVFAGRPERPYCDTNVDLMLARRPRLWANIESPSFFNFINLTLQVILFKFSPSWSCGSRSSFKWVKITHICLIWDETFINLDVWKHILFPITFIPPADRNDCLFKCLFYFPVKKHAKNWYNITFFSTCYLLWLTGTDRNYINKIIYNSII